MKRRDLIKKLEKAGFKFLRNGGKHDIYQRGDNGREQEKVPRHNEIDENLAKGIIKKWGL